MDCKLKQWNDLALRIRWGIVNSIEAKGGGHIGGCLDLAELLAVLYSDFMRVRPEEPRWAGRDFLVCSKGHAGPALYSVLALKGFFDVDLLQTLNQEGSSLPGHCDRLKVPGVDATSGSLGQGLSIASGLALSSRLRGKGQRVFCITGDGESAEGQIWEAAQFAAHHNLDNLVAFLDKNNMQIDGSTDRVMSLGDPVAKYRAFGWEACRVDGSDAAAIAKAVARAIDEPSGKPAMIVLDTVKGNNINCIANLGNNHCIAFSGQLAMQAKTELADQAKQLGITLP